MTSSLTKYWENGYLAVLVGLALGKCHLFSYYPVLTSSSVGAGYSKQQGLI
jgi:hypothetical protein